MANLRHIVGTVAYALACLAYISGLSTVVYTHWPLWRDGRFVLGAFTASTLLLFGAVGGVSWAAGHFSHRRPRLDLLLMALTLTAVLVVWWVPSRFSVD